MCRTHPRRRDILGHCLAGASCTAPGGQMIPRSEVHSFVPPGYTLTFQDVFDTLSLDTSGEDSATRVPWRTGWGAATCKATATVPSNVMPRTTVSQVRLSVSPCTIRNLNAAVVWTVNADPAHVTRRGFPYVTEMISGRAESHPAVWLLRDRRSPTPSGSHECARSAA